VPAPRHMVDIDISRAASSATQRRGRDAPGWGDAAQDLRWRWSTSTITTTTPPSGGGRGVGLAVALVDIGVHRTATRPCSPPGGSGGTARALRLASADRCRTSPAPL
jgi:hypothetical protein